MIHIQDDLGYAFGVKISLVSKEEEKKYTVFWSLDNRKILDSKIIR